MTKEEKAEYQKAYKEANKERLAAYKKEYYMAHKEQYAARNKAYREAHKGQAPEYQKAYYEAHKERIAMHQKTYNHTKKGRARKLLDHYKHQDKVKERGECTLTSHWIVDNIFSGQVCHWCGESNWMELGCDRIDNDLPHTPENVVCSCDACNSKRGSKTYDEYRRLINTKTA